MNANRLAAEFIASASWKDLPESVKAKVRMCLVDNLGATLAGTLARVSQIGADYSAAAWPGDQATILLSGKKASVTGAAFANACAANAIDVDDSARYAYGHAGVQIFATALAVAEGRGLSGAEMLTGMVVGYEIAHRVGRCWHASRPEYQACGSWGSVVCAAVAAHLMKLPVEQIIHALGIAEFHAPNLPMMRDVDHPGMVKHGVEWAAMTGICAAELAGRGFTGMDGILSFAEYQEWGADIGQEFLMVDGVAWKSARYACCGWAHAGVEGAYQLVKQNQLEVDQIAHILVEGCHGSYRLGTRLPLTLEQAQFNQAWPIAAMLIDGEIGPEQVLESRLSDPRLKELAEKVEVVESEEMEGLRRLFEQGDPRGRFASKVTITMKDGRKVHSGIVDGGLSFPPVGWDTARMSDKFRWAAGFVLPSARTEELLRFLWSFDQAPDVCTLTEPLLRPAHRRSKELKTHPSPPAGTPRDGNDLTAEFIHSLDWDDLPAQVQQRARLCLLDILGGILGGALLPASRISAECAASIWPGNASTIFCCQSRARPAAAAFANSVAANGLGLDDRAFFSRGYPGAQVVPTVLAVGEMSGASGKAILEALVIGYEIAIRAGRCWHADHPDEQASGSWGSVASAAAAARLFGLDHDQIKHALGIADYHAPNAPLTRSLARQSMLRHGTGWGALNGIISAELAQRAFTGIPSLLGSDRFQAWLSDLGQTYWMVDGIFHSGCTSSQNDPTACLGLLEEKFRRLADPMLAPAASESIVEQIRLFEKIENGHDFCRQFQFHPTLHISHHEIQLRNYE